MRVLLTGAGGFVGSHILDALLSTTDHEVIVVDSFTDNGTTDRVNDAAFGSPSARIGLPNIASRLRVITHDLRAPFSPVAYDAIEHIGLVIHAAAHCSVDESIHHPRETILNNVASTISILDFAVDIGVDRFLLVSTDEVLGPHTHLSGAIDHEPSSPYAASKAACEDIAHAYDETYGTGLTVVRSQNMFGERQSQLAFTPRLIRALLYDEVVNIHTREGIPGFRWYTYVGNVAAWIAAWTGPEHQGEGVYEMRGQIGIDVLKWAQMIADIMGRDLKYQLVEGKSYRPGWDATYPPLPRSTTWDPQIDAAEALERTVGWFTAHPEWLTHG